MLETLKANPEPPDDSPPAMAAGVGILTDLPYSGTGVRGGEMSADTETANARVPTAKYTKMGETLRHVIPGHMQCSMACGGKACKYENPSRWSDEEQAVKGLYSSWITDNLLAMARPSSEIIERYHVIEQFHRCGLKTVINLQRPGEHASCGNPLEQESGFTYRPETFMEAGVYYYNFGWKDYGVASLTTILDMVKVMSFAGQEGKMAVHCHAGLGRTGVLLACYLVFTSRMTADQAILFIRAKRPNSIQTRGQLLCVREFAQFLVPLRSVFSCAEPKAGAVTLSQYLTRQRHLLHGYEARQMKHVPKIVQLVCALLLDIAANRQVAVKQELPEIPDLTAELEKTVSQQALQQLGKEMRGKGIPVSPCLSNSLSPQALPTKAANDQPLTSDNDLDPLWGQQNIAGSHGSPLARSRRLSYSDSVLHKHALHPGNPKSTGPFDCPVKQSLTHSSLSDLKHLRLCELSPQGHIGDIRPDHWSPFIIKNQQHKRVQSLSSDLFEPGRKGHEDAALPASSTTYIRHMRCDDEQRDTVEEGNVVSPVITIQAELPPESRRLLVAKVLAADATDRDVTAKVTQWQTELNSKEGAWERLCVERDPLVLSGLMWSWLEQLKDPVISGDDVKALSGKDVSPQNALDSLDKGHRLTLLCVLDCAAHLLPMPADVETRFLHQTIRAFTKIDPTSEENEPLYETLKAILAHVLHQLRDKVEDMNGDA